jgi:cobalt-zinc-cadmium efflux system membrane fusion protein
LKTPAALGVDTKTALIHFQLFMKNKINGSRDQVHLVNRLVVGLAALGLVAVIAGGYFYLESNRVPETLKAVGPQVIRVGSDEIQLAAEQTLELKVGAVEALPFEARRDAIGIIDYNQDMAVQVFSPYQGRIGNLMVRAGDDVRAGQVLYTVQIPDLAAAASLLITTGGTLKVANQTQRRAQALYETQSIALKELQQNTADQQAADANYRAARKTLSLFGLVSKDIDDIDALRKVETEMPVRSPFAGRITARAGAIGQLVQPGSGTAPLMVANLQTLWMVASVPESEVASYSLGQAVAVKVAAYPDTAFSGKISYIGDVADAVTHRITVRAEVANGRHLLKPQMLANFDITLGRAVASVAVPANALAREGDGSISAWVTQDGTRFKRRKVQTGMTQAGMVQVLSGLALGEKIARDKALFLSNLYLITVN